MTRSALRRAALAAAAAVALSTIGTGVAHAERLAFTDRRGDVWSVDLDALVEEEITSPEDIPFEAEPNVKNGDIERTVLRHGRRTVSVHVDFAELRRAGEFRGDFLTFRTDTGARRMVMLFAGQGLWRGEMDVIRPGAGEILECGATHKIDYAENTVDLRFPRACFGEPRWLQMRAESGWARLEAGRVYGDNAHNRAPQNWQFTQRVFSN